MQPQVPPSQSTAPQPQYTAQQPPLSPNAEACAIPVDVRQHVHHSYIWLGSIRAFGFALFAIIIASAGSIYSLIASLSERVSGGQASISAVTIPLVIAIVIIGLIALFGIVVGIHALAYRFLWYEVGSEEFNLYSGIISKKRVHVPYQRIQSVDQRASLIQRIFGVCNVSIDTAGGVSNKAILIPYLSKQQAELLRNELYARKICAEEGRTYTQTPVTSQDTAPSAGNILDAGAEIWNEFGGVFAGQAVATEQTTYEYGLSNKELIFTGLSNSTGFVVAVFVVICAIVQFVSGAFDIAPEGTGQVMDTVATTATTYGIEKVSLVVIGILLVCALVVWILSIINSCISFGGFHARRRGTRIEVEHGLLQHQSQSVDVSRVQSVVMKQTFIRRLLGYCELSLGKVDAQEASDPSKQNTTATGTLVIHPFIKLNKVQGILNGLVPEFADIPKETTAVAKVALRRALIRRCLWHGSGFWLAVFTLALQTTISLIVSYSSPEDAWVLPYVSTIATIVYILCAFLLLADIAGAILWYKDSCFATNKRFILLTNGGLSKQTTAIPRNKIQYGQSKTNPLQRLAKTATISARTAAGVGGTTLQLIDVSQEDADCYLDWMIPGHAL